MKKKTIFIGLLLLFATLGISSVIQAQDTGSAATGGLGLENSVVNVANTTGRAVVSISTEHTTKMPGMNRRVYRFGSPFEGNDPFERFFDDFFGEIPEREFKQRGLGSGVIINAEGYILTNEHVVNDADKITVTLPDGREFKGEVKGADPRSDLAVIKISAHNLPLANLGNSDSLKIGQWVVAIGNPFGFAMDNPEPTVTVGVVSALHRTLGRAVSRNKDYGDLIQTDAAINPGNSGGPLVNLKGEVVGINVAIFSTSGGYQGVGFAIPINNAKKIISKLIEGKKIVYGWLGVTIQDINEDLAKYFGLTDRSGALVAKVLADGPADKAGMKEGDIIKQFDNKPVVKVKDLLNVVGNADVGRKMKVVVIRDKKEVSLTVEIGERPEDVEAIGRTEESAAGPWRGLQVDSLNSDTAKRYKAEARQGVIAVSVKPESQAYDAGIIPGDVISEINKQAVTNLSDYQKATKGVKGDCLVKTLRGYFVIKAQ